MGNRPQYFWVSGLFCLGHSLPIPFLFLFPFTSKAGGIHRFDDLFTQSDISRPLKEMSVWNILQLAQPVPCSHLYLLGDNSSVDVCLSDSGSCTRILSPWRQRDRDPWGHPWWVERSTVSRVTKCWSMAWAICIQERKSPNKWLCSFITNWKLRNQSRISFVLER